MNPFLRLAEHQTPAPVKARERAADRRRSTRAQQRDDEQQKLSTLYKRHRKRELDDALAGSDGRVLQALIGRLDTLTLETIPDLTAFVRAAAADLEKADTRVLAHRLTGERVMRLRAQANLPPFDDPLPDAPATPEWDLHRSFAEQETSDG